MSQKQYVEKPYKVIAEQFDPEASPLQVGVCACVPLPELLPVPWTGPHVHTPTKAVSLVAGDWIYRDLFDEQYDVMSDAEFSAKFGGGA